MFKQYAVSTGALKTRATTISRMIAVIGIAAPATLFAQQATDLGTVGSTGAAGTGDGRAPGASSGTAPASRAAQVAPTQSSLQATQPQSIIQRTFIEESKSPVTDFSGIAVIAPSMSLGISVNGPGLGETKATMRGFPDGQYNITWDGIPFGDTNGPTHHSTAYFPASVIGRVEVERGPGNASNLGQATFGGSVNLFSRELSKEQNFGTFFSFGTWNTQLYGLSYDSGLSKGGDTLLGINAQHMSSDGYRTYSGVNGDNLALKVQKPMGDHTLMTINLNYNRNWYYLNDNERGLTNAEAAQFGKNYNLSADPTRQNFYGYNRVQKSTEMNYLRLQSAWGNGWATDNQAYYYNYTNNGLTSTATDMTNTFVIATIKTATGANTTGIPGGLKTNEYKVYGDVFKATKETSAGLARVGVWLEKADTHRSFYDLNLLGGITPNYDLAAAGPFGPNNNVLYEQKSGWKQYQPFAEFEWAVTRDLKVTPGLKYMHTDLTIDALVNQTGRTTQNFTKNFTATLPFLTANYAITKGWNTYFQYAKGMLVPNIGSYQSANALATNINPQTTTNYQLGLVHQSGNLTFDTDIYYIAFNNKIAQLAGTPGNAPVFYNQGSVTYKGVEGQITYALPMGFSLYANGSINRATTNANGQEIAGVPSDTAALGALFRHDGWSSTLFYKRVGRVNAIDGAYPLPAYDTLDFNVGYLAKNPGMGFKTLKLQVGVFNVLNKQNVIAATPANRTVGAANYGVPATGDVFQWQPPRSMMATLRADF